MITAILAGLDATQYKMTSDEIVNLYFEYTGGQDVGVDLGDWLLWLFGKGLIKGFVKLQLSEMDAALSLGLVVVVGVNLNPQAYAQVQNGQPWDVSPGDEPDPQDGHAIDYIKAESATGSRTWASWGQQVESTYAWYQACPQQAFGVITDPDFLEKNGFPVATLVADLTALRGTVDPLGGTSAAPRSSEGFTHSVENAVHDVASFVDEDLKHLLEKFPGLEQLIKREIEKSLAIAVPVILSKEFETLAKQLLIGLVI
jgi:hypothetical protein